MKVKTISTQPPTVKDGIVIDQAGGLLLNCASSTN